ncbi:hypothetical protein [Streptomyces sp. NPDC054838]
MADRYITLDPAEGTAGSAVTVLGSGFGGCQTCPSPPAPDTSQPGSGAGLAPEPTPGVIEVTWEGGTVIGTAEAADDQTFTADVTVPPDAAPGTHDVTARCTVNSKARATAQFTVTHVPAVATLALDPAQGPVRTSVRVTGSGFEDCVADGGSAGDSGGTVALAWDGGPLAAEPPGELTVVDGSFTARVSVPPGTDAADHTVTAACVGYEQLAAEAAFTVTAAPVPPPGPELTLDPDSLPVGGGVTDIAGSGFNCSPVDLLWDGEQTMTVDTADDGTFEAQLAVPPEAGAAPYTVRGQCATQPDVAVEAVFTVTATGPVSPTPTPVPPTPTPDPTPGPGDTVPVGLAVGASLLGVALLAAVGAAFLARAHRGPRWIQGHLTSRLRPAAAATEVTEPSDAGPPGRSVRLEPHPDPGDQTVEEEDP